MNEKYVKRSLLGEGGRGTVWLVENKDAGMPAALKWYEGGGKEAERERKILRRFGGKGIPYLIDYIENEQGAGIVMEYVEGKSLRSLLGERKIWSEKEAVELIMKAAGILAVFHRQIPAIVYGDLKPENIMVTPGGDVYLIDFGSVLYEGERERKVFGTKEYLPPSEEETISAYRDTYGLGVILYEMLTGSVLLKGITDKKADISHLSHECRRIMQKAVKIHETEGYANGGEMYEDLKEYMGDLCREKKERKKHMFKRKNREKKDYFISDLRRLVCTGYMRGICLVFAGLAVLGIAWRGNEVKGAAMEEIPQEELVVEQVTVRNGASFYENTYYGENTEEVRAENPQEKEGVQGKERQQEKEKQQVKKSPQGKEGMQGNESLSRESQEEIGEKEIPKDAYGRKLIIRE